MYYLNDKQRQACRYFESLEKFTESQAENAIRFCCSVCGCTREEQTYLLEWVFDGYYVDMVHFGYKEDFWRLLNFCGDCWTVSPDEPEYEDYLACMGEECMVGVEYMDPSGRLLVWNL